MIRHEQREAEERRSPARETPAHRDDHREESPGPEQVRGSVGPDQVFRAIRRPRERERDRVAERLQRPFDHVGHERHREPEHADVVVGEERGAVRLGLFQNGDQGDQREDLVLMERRQTRPQEHRRRRQRQRRDEPSRDRLPPPPASDVPYR